MGQVGLEWSVAGFGDFSGNANETDMLMRNNNTGEFELYDISNNTIVSAVSMGQVGLEWQVAGFGPINGAGTSDMLMRNSNTGAFEIYDIANNQLTSAAADGPSRTGMVGRRHCRRSAVRRGRREHSARAGDGELRAYRRYVGRSSGARSSGNAVRSAQHLDRSK